MSAYVALANITLSTATNSVTFSSIPNTYRDLIFVISGQLVINSATDTSLRFNGDTGTNYQRVYAYGDGSTTASGVSTESALWPWYAVNTAGNAIGQIMDYSRTGAYKVILSRQNTPGSLGLSIQGQRWVNTSAITSMTFSTLNNYAVGTNFALYGITA